MYTNNENDNEKKKVSKTKHVSKETMWYVLKPCYDLSQSSFSYGLLPLLSFPV